MMPRYLITLHDREIQKYSSRQSYRKPIYSSSSSSSSTPTASSSESSARRAAVPVAFPLTAPFFGVGASFSSSLSASSSSSSSSSSSTGAAAATFLRFALGTAGQMISEKYLRGDKFGRYRQLLRLQLWPALRPLLLRAQSRLPRHLRNRLRYPRTRTCKSNMSAPGGQGT